MVRKVINNLLFRQGMAITELTDCEAALDLLCPLDFDFPEDIHLPYHA